MRLSSSRALPRMADYLIVKLAANNSHRGKVSLSMKDAAFTNAIQRLQACYHGDAATFETKTPEPFINVFGTAGHGNLGYRTIKYLSNGTADSVTQKIWGKVLTVYDEKPRAISFNENHAEQLPVLLLKKAEGEPLPRLDDTAVWYFRSTDLATLTMGSDPHTDLQDVLRRAFASELALSDDELSALFEEKQPHRPVSEEPSGNTDPTTREVANA